MKNNLVFKKVVDSPSSRVYRYENLSDERITGQVECMETDLFSDLSRMIDVTRRYLDMAFTMASEHPETFDAASAQEIAERLLDYWQVRIESIFDLLQQKQGIMMVATAPRGDSDHIHEDQVVDVYIDESRKSG